MMAISMDQYMKYSNRYSRKHNNQFNQIRHSSNALRNSFHNEIIELSISKQHYLVWLINYSQAQPLSTSKVLSRLSHYV